MELRKSAECPSVGHFQQRHALPPAAEPDMAARSCEIRMPEHNTSFEMRLEREARS